MIRKLIVDKKNQYNNEDLNPLLKWEMMKSDIRGQSIKYSSEIKKKNIKKIKTLEAEINSLQSEFDSSNDTSVKLQNRITSLKVELQQCFEKKTEGVILRAKAIWLKDAERNTKYFFNLEKRNYMNKSIQSLIDDEGNLISDFHKILQEEAGFYGKLYGLSPSDDNYQSFDDDFFPVDASIQKLSIEDADDCEGYITGEECVAVIKSFQNGNHLVLMGYQLSFIKYFGMI